MPLFNPAHPGELIRETIVALSKETGKTVTMEEVAAGLGVSRKTLSVLVNAKQSITPEMAIKLETAFKNTTAEFWLRVQDSYDLAKARKKVKTNKIKVFWKPVPAL